MNELSKIEITELIPQRAPFLMIDSITSFDTGITCTAFTVDKNNLFVEEGQFVEAGIIENIAQTCAARMGYINKFLNNEEVRLGFIGAIKNLNIHSLPKVGDEIKTTIEVLSEYFNLTLAHAKSVCNNKVIAECEMKISLA